MAIKHSQRGFTLLIAVIFVSVMLALGLTLSSLGFKQSILASSGTESQYAFYAADAALECALRVDQHAIDMGIDNPFSYSNGLSTSASFPCGDSYTYAANNFGALCYNTGSCPLTRITYWRIPIAYTDPTNRTSGTETRCADVTVYKSSTNGQGTTYIFAQGYDVKCSLVTSGSTRISARGLQANY